MRIVRAEVLAPGALVPGMLLFLWLPAILFPLPPGFMSPGLLVTGAAHAASTSATSGAIANPFEEVPAGHWSYRALETLSAAEILPELVPGTYVPPGASVGHRAITRLEMAILTARFVARLSELGQFRTGEVFVRPTGTAAEGELTKIITSFNAANPGKRPLTLQQISALERLVHEYARELSILGVRFPLIAGAEFGKAGAGTADAAVRESHAITPAAQSAGIDVFKDLDEVSDEMTGMPGMPRKPRKLEIQPPVVLELPLLLPSENPGLERLASVIGLSPGVGLAGGALGSPEAQAGAPGEVLLDTTLAIPAGSFGRQVALVQGRYRLGEKVTLTGEFSGDAKAASPNNGAVKVGASVKVGEVEVGAGLQNTPVVPSVTGNAGSVLLPADNPGSLNPSFKGYNISFKFGKVAVSTGFDSLQTGQDPRAATMEKAKGVDLGYNLTEAATVKAGYALVDSDAVGAAGKEGISGQAKTKASLALDLRLPNEQKLRAGVSVERPALNANSANTTTNPTPPAPPDGTTGGTAGASASASAPPTPAPTTTTFGLGYDFSPNSSLLLYYKMITIPGVAELEKELANVAAAELSIKF